MKLITVPLLALFATTSLSAETLPDVKRILFLGDSITHDGKYIEYVETVLIADTDKRYEILGLGLSSETVSGLSEDGHASGKFPRPDLHERLDRVLATTKPELILACYGMNCGIYQPLDDGRFQKYKDGIQWLRDKAKAAGVKDVIHLTPPTYDPVQKKGEAPFYNDVLGAYGKWLLDRGRRHLEAQRTNNWQVVDIHNPMDAALAELRKKDPAAFISKDGVHPGPEGHWLMAQQILRHWGVKCDYTIDDFTAPDGRLNALHKLVSKRQKILNSAYLSAAGHKRPGVALGLPLDEAMKQANEITKQIDDLATKGTTSQAASAFPGTKSNWNGYDKYDFTVDGKPVLVVAPKTAAPGKPWVWHGEFFGHKPAPDVALLGKGFHIVYMSVPNMLGSPEAVKHWNALYAELTTKYGFSKKAALVGLSRGGLYCYNWAAANPDKVACIYGDAPVCDFKSWPGGKGKGKGDPTNWGYVLKLWGFKDEAEAMAAKVNPIDHLEPLAKNHVPLLHVFGDADKVVPWDENTGVVEERYKNLGGSITLIRKPGVDHHPHGLDDSTPIIEFIEKNATSTR